MSKGCGGTKNSTWRNKCGLSISQSDSIHQIQAKIYKAEIGSAVLNHKPSVVSNEKYTALLNSGEYIEVYRGFEESKHAGQMLKGDFHFYANNDSGSGYYFTTDKAEASIYTSSKSPAILRGLIKKSDIVSDRSFPKTTNRDLLSKIVKDRKSKDVISNGAYGIKEYYPNALVAAKQGKVLSSHYGDNIVVVDRSKIILPQSDYNKYK